MSTYPRNEPLSSSRVTLSFHGDSYSPKRFPEQRWLVIGWLAERPDAGHIWGPFRTQTEARQFGRKYYPRRYQVSGMHAPERAEHYYTGKQAAEKAEDR